MSSSFTCNTCGLAFPTSGGQKEHMRSDWHRYNLKRRVAQLPSISMDTFNEKVSKMTIAEEEVDPNISKRELRKQKKEEIMRQRMELLQKARMAMMQKEEENNNTEEKPEMEENDKEEHKEDELEEQEDEDETEEAATDALLQKKLKSQIKIAPNTCLFCKNHESKDIPTNLEHMFMTHGLYVPEKKYLTNAAGLLEYLGEKIGLGNVCLVCNYQGKNVEAVRAHMLAKQHCRLPYESEDEKLEISDFYDFSSTYAAPTKSEIAGNDEDWEDVSGGEEGDEEEDDDDDDEFDQDVLYNDGVELYLPTGIKVGHRSLQRYFKQDLKPEKTLTEGQGTVVAAETRHLVSIVDKKEMAVQQRVWKTEISNKKRNDKRAAKFINNQPHFRDPLLQ